MARSTPDRGEPVAPGPPVLPAPPIAPGRRARSTPRPALTTDAIVTAAIEVLRSDGVNGLSMRLVAKRLRTGAASLYVHVANKDELLELIFDELVSRVPIPEPDPDRWQEQLRDLAVALRAELQTFSQVALAGLGRIPISYRSLAAAESTLALLHAGGLPPKVIGLAADLLALYIVAGVFEESLFEKRGLSEDELGEYVQQIHDFYAALPADRFPMLATMAAELTESDGHDRFLFGLDVLIAGLIAVGARG